MELRRDGGGGAAPREGMVLCRVAWGDGLAEAFGGGGAYWSTADLNIVAFVKDLVRRARTVVVHGNVDEGEERTAAIAVGVKVGVNR